MVRVEQETSSGRRREFVTAPVPVGSVGPVVVAIGRWSSGKGPLIPPPRPAGEDLVALAAVVGVLV